MQPPIVSVVIPCYNASATLAGAVESAIAQDVDTQIILVDDGSTDDTPTLIRQLVGNFGNRVLGINQANEGPAAARNRGIQLAAGRYLCFLDADDVYKAGFFSRAAKMLDQTPSTVAVECRIELTHTDRKVEPWQLSAMESTMAGNLMLRAEIVRLLGGFPIDRAFRGKIAGEDGCLRLQLPNFGETSRLDFVGLGYRVQPGSHTDLFLQRSRLENGRVVFDSQSAEEADGSFGLAIQRYRDEISHRMVDRACEQILTEIAAVANLKTFRNLHAPKPIDDGTVEGFSLYTLAKRWPVVGDVLELTTSPLIASTQWLGAGCAASHNGKVTSERAAADKLFRLVSANIATIAPADAMSIAASQLPRGGLCVVYTDRGALPAASFAPTAHWRERFRFPRLCAMEKLS